MSKKQLIISIIIAVFIGVIMGGIDKIFNLDLSFFPFLIPVVFFGGFCGISQATSKKKHDK